MLKKAALYTAPLATLLWMSTHNAVAAEVRIPDTGQNRCYSNSRAIPCPAPGSAFHGQDAHYQGTAPQYRDNKDGTVTDLSTGLMWSQAVSLQKSSLQEAQRQAQTMILAGYNDWRLPNIKELYSLIDFRGYSGFSRRQSSDHHGEAPFNAIPFINTDYFDFRYGGHNERYIDAQWLSSTLYSSTTMAGDETLFGVNFADGRIKGYGFRHQDQTFDHKRFYVRYVRGKRYGDTQLIDNGDGTVSDKATGLTWARMDSGRAMNWQQALAYAEGLDLAGHRDWRLPNAKELQYLVDYNRAPDSSHSPAIDPIFKSTQIRNENGKPDYAAYWTSTTHLDGPDPGGQAVYIAFGRALGAFNGEIIDVHGAGAQRSDPKSGAAEIGRGPQGDLVRVNNFVRVVRGGAATPVAQPQQTNVNAYPYSINLTPKAMPAKRSRMSDRPPHPTGPEEFGRHFVSRLDRDGDGQVSRQEFDGPAQFFDHHDYNGNGYLSADEAPPPPPPGRHRQQP